MNTDHSPTTNALAISPAHDEAFRCVGVAVQWVCERGQAITSAQYQAMMRHTPQLRALEVAMDAACLAGDVEATKQAGRAWGKAFVQAMRAFATH